jgi:uncharacterized membrane protein
MRARPPDVHAMKIIIIATIFILIGAAAAMSMLYDASNQRININLNVCCLLVGIGLMRGRESSLKWAKLFTYLYLVPSVVLLFVLPTDFMHSRVYQSLGLIGVDYYIVCYGAALGVILLCAWVLHALTVEGYRHHPLI